LSQNSSESSLPTDCSYPAGHCGASVSRSNLGCCQRKCEIATCLAVEIAMMHSASQRLGPREQELLRKRAGQPGKRGPVQTFRAGCGSDSEGRRRAPEALQLEVCLNLVHQITSTSYLPICASAVINGSFSSRMKSRARAESFGLSVVQQRNTCVSSSALNPLRLRNTAGSTNVADTPSMITLIFEA
jgi:hypothetical protein